MSYEFILACARPVLAERIERAVARLGASIAHVKCADQAATAATGRPNVAIVVAGREIRALRPLRKLRKQGSLAPVLIIGDEGAARPLQHLATWAEFIERATVLYSPFTDAELLEALRKITDPRFKG